MCACTSGETESTTYTTSEYGKFRELVYIDTQPLSCTKRAEKTYDSSIAKLSKVFTRYTSQDIHITYMCMFVDCLCVCA